MSSDKYLKYEYKYVVFIDILGFKNKIYNSKNPKEIIEIINALKEEFYKQNNSKPKLNLEITQVSDCIIISFKKDNNFQMFQMIMIIAYVQANAFVKYGLSLRGACSLGEIIHDKNYLFGKAYQDSYALEEKSAMYPRIIFNKDLINELTMEEKVRCLELLSKDENYYYVDIFKSETTSSDNIEKQKEFFKKSKIIIEQHLEKYQKIVNKYLWLKNEYNRRIIEFNTQNNESLEKIE